MPKVKLTVSNNQKKVEVPNGLRTTIRKCCEQVLKNEEFDDNAEVSLTYVDNEGIRELNKEYRDKDKETDVLSFPMSEDGIYDVDPDTDSVILGDIVISLEKAEAQAKEYGHSFEREVAFLATHSMLHLLGYDHELGEKEEKDMFARQNKALDDLGIVR